MVEYAGTRIVLEGRVRELVRLLMRDGEKMHLEDATGVAFDWGGTYTNWHVTLRGSATAPPTPAESVSWTGKDTRDA